ncbi:uncharacterized protein LOC113471163, partial [Diaphorina citri]|uniref:Uncharacterized protein LOC113471163 n=1 Tax=Diaphorina citri TaxID=121845 RepID=A0A3Q0JBT1_DIACI
MEQHKSYADQQHKKKKLPPLPPLPGKYVSETKFVLKSPPSSSALVDGAQPTSNTYQSLTNYNSFYKYEKFSSASENFVKPPPPPSGKIVLKVSRSERNLLLILGGIQMTFYKYEKFSSASENFVKPPPPPSGKIVLKVSRSERNLLLILGGIQMTCGLLMVVFAILAILHDAALSSFAAGIWSGAMSLGCGFVGVLSGIRSCYHSRHHVSVLCLTIYLALGLINVAVDNLALVIASTGLLRDAQRPTYFVPLQEDDLGLVDAHVEVTNWAPVLSNLGLVITLTVQCLVTITSVLKCYRHVCVCSRTRRSSGESMCTPHSGNSSAIFPQSSMTLKHDPSATDLFFEMSPTTLSAGIWSGAMSLGCGFV